MWSVMPQQEEKPYWVSFSFGSIISRHLFQGTWQPKCWIFEISQKASPAAQNGLAGPVAYLGFPAPGYKLTFGAPTQPVHGSIDAKNKWGIKRRRKLTRALQSKISCDCDGTEWTIIGYCRVKNPIIVSREAIPSAILVISNCFITTLQIAVIFSRIVAISEMKCKN